MSATRRGVCFRNLGNTCYIDSVLILYGSDPRLVQRECECKDCVSNEFCLLKSAHNLIKRQQESKHKISPTTIYNNLHSINHGYFERNRQYDAGAFLNSLLSQIQTTLSSQISDFAAPYLHSHCTVTTCRRCKYSRNSIVPATTIQLYDLDKHNNIIQCLDDLKSEDLNDVKGNNLIRCGRCNRKTKHQMETHYIPGDTLYLCLNRSTQIDDEDEQVDAFYIKNNKYIEFYDQFEYFNKTWKMFAMVEHMGGEDDAGHCIAYRNVSGSWYLYDDLKAKPRAVSGSYVFKQQATILGYYASPLKYEQPDCWNGLRYPINQQRQGWILHAGDRIRYRTVSSNLITTTIISIPTREELSKLSCDLRTINVASLYPPQWNTELELRSESLYENPVSTTASPIYFSLCNCKLIPSSIPNTHEEDENKSNINHTLNTNNYVYDSPEISSGNDENTFEYNGYQGTDMEGPPFVDPFQPNYSSSSSEDIDINMEDKHVPSSWKPQQSHPKQQSTTQVMTGQRQVHLCQSAQPLQPNTSRHIEAPSQQCIENESPPTTGINLRKYLFAKYHCHKGWIALCCNDIQCNLPRDPISFYSVFKVNCLPTRSRHKYRLSKPQITDMQTRIQCCDSVDFLVEMCILEQVLLRWKLDSCSHELTALVRLQETGCKDSILPLIQHDSQNRRRRISPSNVRRIYDVIARLRVIFHKKGAGLKWRNDYLDIIIKYVNIIYHNNSQQSIRTKMHKYWVRIRAFRYLWNQFIESEE
eukprot:164088_1